MVRLNPGESQGGTAGDSFGQPHDGFRGLDAATVRPDVELDEHVHRRPGRLRCGGQRLHAAQLIHAHRDLCAPREGGDPSDFTLPDNLVTDAEVPHAPLGHDLGLRDLLTAHPDRTSRNLHVRDHRRLVGLGVWTEIDPAARCNAPLHSADVPLQRVQLNQQRGSIHLGDMHPNDCRG